MGSSEKLCLQWNDFKENILLSFQAQRDDRDFRDVTLAYEDGQHIEVYYIIFRQKCLIGLYFKLSLYEKVSDQGPVWVRSEDKIPSDFISIHDIYIWLPEYSSVP